jgi:molybdopterin molybdotransferase
MTSAPRAPLMPLDEALSTLLQLITPLTGVESVATFDADGRVLAEDVVSALQVPAFDNSSMDGYAVRCEDLVPGAVLLITQRIPAGHQGQPLQPGQVARIFTGAPVPAGADAIVMQEQVQVVEDGDTPRVRFLHQAQVGEWIRRSGEDIRQGQTALRQGQKLGPAELGLAASLGLAHLKVVARPRVALFSTG